VLAKISSILYCIYYISPIFSWFHWRRTRVISC